MGDLDQQESNKFKSRYSLRRGIFLLYGEKKQHMEPQAHIRNYEWNPIEKKFVLLQENIKKPIGGRVLNEIATLLNTVAEVTGVTPEAIYGNVGDKKMIEMPRIAFLGSLYDLYPEFKVKELSQMLMLNGVGPGEMISKHQNFLSTYGDTSAQYQSMMHKIRSRCRILFENASQKLPRNTKVHQVDSQKIGEASPQIPHQVGRLRMPNRKEYETLVNLPYTVLATKLMECFQELYGVSRQMLERPSRKRILTDLRKIYLFVVHDFHRGAMSLEKMGEPFKRDHATVLHAVRTHNTLIEKSVEYREKYIAVVILLIDKTKPYVQQHVTFSLKKIETLLAKVDSTESTNKFLVALREKVLAEASFTRAELTRYFDRYKIPKHLLV
jgi:hypothetical protein